MELQADAVVDISPNKVHYFGGPGKMLLPCLATVEALLATIPEHVLITTDLLRKKLANQFKVRGTCPVTTRKVLWAIAHGADTNVAYWRVIKANGELNAFFPGGIEGQAALLRQEGFTIDTQGKVPKVKNFKTSLVRFE